MPSSYLESRFEQDMKLLLRKLDRMEDLLERIADDNSDQTKARATNESQEALELVKTTVDHLQSQAENIQEYEVDISVEVEEQPTEQEEISMEEEFLEAVPPMRKKRKKMSEVKVKSDTTSDDFQDVESRQSSTDAIVCKLEQINDGAEVVEINPQSSTDINEELEDNSDETAVKEYYVAVTDDSYSNFTSFIKGLSFPISNLGTLLTLGSHLQNYPERIDELRELINERSSPNEFPWIVEQLIDRNVYDECVERGVCLAEMFLFSTFFYLDYMASYARVSYYKKLMLMGK